MCLQIIAGVLLAAPPAHSVSSAAYILAPLAGPTTTPSSIVVLGDNSSTRSLDSAYVRDLRLKPQPPAPEVKPAEPPKPPPPYAPLSYRYAELVFSSTDLDLLESDQSGIAAAVSWPLTERFYVRGSYARETVDTSLVIGLGSVAAERATDTISLTGGVRHGLTERVDLIGELLVGYSSLQLDIDTGGSGSTDQMLFGGRGGARWIFDRRMEFELDLRAVDTDDTEAEIGFGFGARFHATDNISLGLNYIGLDTADTIAGGIRFSW